MEDSDSARDADSEMADYHNGADFSDDVDPWQTLATRESGIGFPVSPFRGEFPGSRFQIGGSRIGKRAFSRFGRDRDRESRSPDWESGSGGRPGRGDFLV
jgi:hypothetical protein